MTAATDQISVNEMRRYFHLKQQPVHFDGKNEEEPATPGNYSKEALEYFQKKISIFTTRWIFRFRPEEVVHAERFLDEKLPEIRQLYRMNLEERNPMRPLWPSPTLMPYGQFTCKSQINFTKLQLASFLDRGLISLGHKKLTVTEIDRSSHDILIIFENIFM